MTLALYLAAINGFAFLLYWYDKHAARRGARRVPEYVLLLTGFIGGTPAALMAQRLLRHKNRKAVFQFKFWALTLVQAALLVAQPYGLGHLL